MSQVQGTRAVGVTAAKWLDRVTGRVTMYRMVTLALVAIALVALAAALLGQLPFEPLALIASAAVAVATTLVTSRVIALILRSRPHTESSVITGLLLFFLFWPSLEIGDLGTLALAALLATASKYLIVWRGRHILNPVAAGALIVALLQLNGAIWWVASGVLLPITALGAFLVLYRTRRLPMALVFVLVSAGIITARLTLAGQGVVDAATTAFASYPVVFFVGFMLTEPLTLAPRRWQQLTIAAIVGVLFAVPFQIGAFSFSFEAALVVGNLIAFAFGQRRAVRLTAIGTRQLTPTSWAIDFTSQHPVAFRPGQYMELAVPHAPADSRGTRRIFSIASAPSADGRITFAVRTNEPSSSFKRSLLKLKPGASVRGTLVGGDFLLPRDTATPVLLIAGGIGITPFLSQLAHDRAERIARDTVLIYRVSSSDELAFVDELADVPVLLVAPTEPAGLPAAWRYIGPEPITPGLITSAVPDAASRASFVSGAPGFVDDARAALKSAGVRRVATDHFSGY